MSSWKSWNLQTWNARLLAYLFGRDEHDSAVVVLLVTADVLARVTTDPLASPDDVRDFFVEAVRTGIRHSRSLLEDASNYEGWPGPPPRERHPRFVAHLLLTCIAASESSEELRDEGSFVLRLRELTGDQLPEHSLSMLPRLWEHLSAWLESNRQDYRALHLPDPGNFTRIGYTVRLAFPDRRDQRQLSELLDRSGLAGHEPPVGSVLSLVSAARADFRRPFLAAFDEFRRLFETCSVKSARRLVEHRFWAAVREAALRGRGQMVVTDPAVRLTLMCEERGDELALFVTAQGPIESREFSSLELPIAYSDWRFALVPSGIEEIDGDGLDQVAREALAGKLRLPRISSHIDQGFLPFVVGAHGLMELAAQDQLGDVTVALIRSELLEDFLRIFARGANSTSTSYPGWVRVDGMDLHGVAIEELNGTSLARTWILQESLLPTCIRVVGGVRADDGWLGTREVLPHITAAKASNLELQGAGGRESLIKRSSGWELPSRDIEGEFNLVASFADEDTEQRKIRFYATPASEDFKPCAEPDAWIVEGLGSTVKLTDSTPFLSLPADRDHEDCTERLAYLGPDVGLFVRSRQHATWIIRHFAGKWMGALGPRAGERTLPVSQVVDAHARRRWRKMLFESVPSCSDAEFARARGQVKRGAASHPRLPRIEMGQPVPDLTALTFPTPVDATDRLVRILAGRASTRAGIDWHDWRELTKRTLGVESHGLAALTRAWMEAGLIDVGSYARWRHRSIFARKPQLVGFRVGEGYGATLTGLALSTTRNHLQRAAEQAGAFVEERRSISSLVPVTLSLRLENAQALVELGRTCGLSVCWLDFEAVSQATLTYHDPTSPPPSHYDAVAWPRWSLTADAPAGLVVEHRVRRDRPDFWLVARGDLRVWTYDLNVARSWGASMLAAPIVSPADETYIEAAHAYLPLPLARVVALVGAGRAGPTASGNYRYPLGSVRLCEQVLDIVARTFDPTRLTAVPSQRATG
jgi:hypothetical protein